MPVGKWVVRRPLALTAFSFAGALAAAQYLLPYGSFPTAACIVLAAGLFALGGVILHKGAKRPLFVAAACVLLPAALGLFWRCGYDALFVKPALVMDGRMEEVSAEALSYPEETPYGGKVTALFTLPDGRKSRGILYIDDANTDIVPGDRLTLPASFKAPLPGGAGDNLAHLRPRGIVLTATQKGEYTFDRPSSVPLARRPALWAEALKEGLSRALPEGDAALAKALITGNKSGLTEGFQSALADTGLSHVVSVSGLHISFLMGFILLIVGNRRRAFWICLPLVPLFIAVAGFPASAVRSGIMLFFFLLSQWLGREGDSLTALAAALFVLTAINPYAVADVGLQLSFASVLGILLFSGRWQRAWNERLSHRVSGEKLKAALRYVTGVAVTSLSALVFTLPLTLLHFGTLSLVSPMANLLTLWAVSAGFLGGLFVALLSLIWTPAAIVLGYLLAPLFAFFRLVVQTLASLPFAALKSAGPYLVFWCVFAYFLFWLYALWPKAEGEKRRYILPLALAAGTLIFSLVLSVIRLDPLEIDVLDTGQGQCILLLTPDATMVIDCGGNVPGVGRAVADRLKSVGRRKIDLLALTHTHADHAGGVADLMEQVEIAALALPAVEGTGTNLRDTVTREAARHNVPVVEIEQTASYPLGEGEIILWPPVGTGGENEMCMSLLVTLGEFEFLVTGDMRDIEERALLRRVYMPYIEVLAAGHHGSKYATSNELLDNAAPQVAVISVGRNNYGHPTRETLERLDGHGISVYRTDEWDDVRILVGEPVAG